jgi:3'-phosphoadenosine 5'-phosphosulfate sulfotransferase (PAPS reductase)/FAD synthetase
MTNSNWLASCRATLQRTLSSDARVALLFSGGIESCLLLKLTEPWRDKITLYTIRTGAEFPHMVSFIDRKLDGRQHCVIKSDLSGSFSTLGLPASVVPIENVPDAAAMMNIEERSPRITPWPLCCTRNRWLPGCEAMVADGITSAVHGQRAGDYPKSAPAPLEYPGLDLVAPLWGVTRSEVKTAVAELGVELPEHYGDYSSSLDCSVCPSSLTTPRRAWMSQNYPDLLKVAEGLHTKVSQAVISALDGDNTKNGFRAQ